MAVQNDSGQRSVERLFPFALRSRILVVGRDGARRRKGRLQFLLITTDISENSREQMLQDFADCPVVQRYTSAELEQHFKVRGAKVIGFLKSGLAKSLYDELKSHRLKPLASSRKPPGSPPVPPTERTARSGSSSRRRDRR